jgi:RimJ/RimL family protein N-acetyltransferase
MIDVRDATPDDLDAIFRFNQELASETESRHLPDDVLRGGILSALTSENKLRYWMAVPSDDPARPIGQAAVSYEWSDWRNGWIWWLQSVFVDADWRGQGAFRSLLDTVRLAASKDSQVIGLRLYVEHENARARAVYVKLGFVPAGYDVMEFFWGDQTTRRSD